MAIAYAGTHPARVERLVIVDIGPDVAVAGRLRVATTMAMAPERFASLEAAVDHARAANPRFDPDLLRHRVIHAMRPLPDGGFALKYDRALRDAIRGGRLRDPIDLWPLLGAIRCPTLIVRGAESDVLSAETAKRMVEVLPTAQLVEVPDAGHTVPGDQPAVFRSLLTRFLSA